MDALLRLLLTNAALSGFLALAAWSASRVVKRQAVVHALWLLALLKLVTPPLVGVPMLPAPATFGPATVESRAPVVPSTAPHAVAALRARRAGPSRYLALRGVLAESPVSEASSKRPAVRRSPPVATSAPGVPWGLAVPAILVLGIAAVFGLSAWRFLRFRSLLSHAEPAPQELVARAAGLAKSLGVARVPPLLVVAARVPPLLWPSSAGPKLLLPRDLLPALDAEECDALLAHELAHVRRRDHWVRFLEVGATALFWWYPVTWWARRSLRRAEERCCDEWVLRALPDSARAYADGILKSLTFLADAPVALPATASGAGPIEDLEARLKEILMTNPLPRLSRPMRFALGATALAALALFPTFPPPRAAEAAAVPVLQDVERTAPPAPAAPVEAPALAPPAPPAAVHGRPAAPAPLAPPSPVAAPGVPGRISPPPFAPGTPHAAGGPGDEPDPALEAERRALDDQRRQLHLSQLELERRGMELEARIERQALAGEVARLRAEGDAAGAARAEKKGTLAARRTDLEKRQLDLQVQQVRLEAEVERADAEGAGEPGSEARQRDAEKAEQELEKKQQALEAEEGKLEREIQALDAEERVHELRGATEDLAMSFAEQIESLRETLPEAGGYKAELEREIERLEAALGALKGTAPKARAPRPATPPAR